MSEDNKTKRLSKLAREFNVGTSTIVDFLNKKGIKTSNDPNMKVSEEAYALLLKEYSSEIKAKKESEELSLGRSKKETITLETEKSNEEVDTSEPEEEVLIKDPSHSQKSLFVPKEKEQENKIDIKVVGKIDLNPPKPKAKPVIKEEPKTEVRVDKKETPKKVKEDIKLAPVKELVIEAKKEEPIEEAKVEIKAEELKVETPIEIPIVEKQIAVQEFYTNSRLEEPDVKVIGKIDLDSLNQKTRPTKKTKVQKEDERKEKEKQIKASKDLAYAQRREAQLNAEENTHGENTTEETNIDNKEETTLFKSHIKKLSGPTIVGKINLPVKDDKAKLAQNESNADSEKRRKKKRKRIKKDKERVAVGADAAAKPAGTGSGAELKLKPKVNILVKQPNKFKLNKKVTRPEVDDEAVQKQIKETLARLTAKPKSKGSKYRKEKRELGSMRRQDEFDKSEQEKNILKVTEFVSVNELATMMDVPANQVIATCMSLGLFVSINQRLDAETMGVVADEFGYKVELISVEVHEAINEEDEMDTEENMVSRSPIVTVMGHVDHGKTKLLDYIRSANVIAGEAGGITQHIGAYSVLLKNGKHITFLDTPGHEAFTAMRARGAQVTDIAIIVIAADDNVMPQTIEAINHAQAAGVPIIFAINKIDKPGANPEKVKEELSKLDFLVEDWGGKYQSQEISAKQGLNVNLLLDKVLLEAEMLELKANPLKRAVGTVIESSLDKGRGYVTTLLVKSGTLRIGDIILAGSYTGHIKAMYNERNQKIDIAPPSTPVLVLGLNGAPQAGDNFNAMSTEREAREIANKRAQLQREQGLRTQKHITLDEIGRRIAIGNFQELNIVVKGDFDGSIEALSDSLIKLSTSEIQVNIIHKAVGQISESDVMLAAASNAIIVGFQVRPSMGARKLAEKEEIDIRLYSIIYDAINEIKSAMEGMLSPEIKEEITATIEIRDVFKITKVGTIAGCMVKDGKIARSSKVRLIRDGIVVYTGELESLKRFKDDVKEVSSGFECGLNIRNFNDIKVGDIIEGYKEIEVERKL